MICIWKLGFYVRNLCFVFGALFFASNFGLMRKMKIETENEIYISFLLFWCKYEEEKRLTIANSQ